MVLLVIDAFVPEDFEESRTDEECNHGVHPFGLEGIAMEQLVSTCKGHALHLKAIKEIERSESKHLV